MTYKVDLALKIITSSLYIFNIFILFSICFIIIYLRSIETKDKNCSNILNEFMKKRI